jgi:hypothetical protein
MGRVISIHEYQLKPGVSDALFEHAVVAARERGLLNLPGLIESRFLRRIRGSGGARYSAIWIYESKDAWEKLWGKIGHPSTKDRYPENWRIWENEVLARLLDRDPDRIEFSTNEEF